MPEVMSPDGEGGAGLVELLLEKRHTACGLTEQEREREKGLRRASLEQHQGLQDASTFSSQDPIILG